MKLKVKQEKSKVNTQDEVVMNEIRNISVTILPMLKAKAYYPTKLKLSMACWVEKIDVSALGTDV